MKNSIKTLVSIAGWLVSLAFAAQAQAETVYMPEDTITASVSVADTFDGFGSVASVCLDGDPLCSAEYECRKQDGVRVCELRGSIVRTATAQHCQTVGSNDAWTCNAEGTRL